MLNFFLMLIGLFLIVLGSWTIYTGIDTYINIHRPGVAKWIIANNALEEYTSFIHAITDADKPIYIPSKPFYNLACIAGVGIIPLSFGILLFVRLAGIF